MIDLRDRPTVPITLIVIAALLGGSSALTERITPPLQPERVKLTMEERALYDTVMAMISQEGAVADRRAVEARLGRPLEDNERAAISAKLYYERGIVGALLSEEESTALQYLLQRKRHLGSLGKLADHLHQNAPQTSSTLEVLRSLEFLYSAGYIDVRDAGQTVHVVLPQGLYEFYAVSSWSPERDAADPFETVRARLSEDRQSETNKRPVTIEKLPEPALAPQAVNASDRPVTEPANPSAPAVDNLATDGTMEPTAPAAGGHRRDDGGLDRAQDGAPEGGPSVSGLESQTVPEPTAPDRTGPVAVIASAEPLGPPLPPDVQIPDAEASVDHDSSGFSIEILKEREKQLLPCAPDFWGWPYLYGQDDVDILAYTVDTASPVRITIRDGRLTSYAPLDVIAVHEGQHGDIHFFQSRQNLDRWRQQFSDGGGQTMTIPEAVAWAHRVLHRSGP